MDNFFALTPSDKRDLAALLKQIRSQPPRNALWTSASPIKTPSPSGFFAAIPCDVVAQLPTGESDKYYPVNACIWHTEDVILPLVTVPLTTAKAKVPMLDPFGFPVRQKVYIDSRDYDTLARGLLDGLSGSIWPIIQHKDGTWWVYFDPKPTTTRTAATTTGAPVTAEPSCQGECLWVADANSVWQWPIGGCGNTSTTPRPTTTTGPTTTPSATTGACCKDGGCIEVSQSACADSGGVWQGLGLSCVAAACPTTTPSPCSASPCVLRCVDTGTTPAPVGGVIIPYLRYVYEVVSGEGCDSPCNCYGAGDPCFLENGEIVSQCVVTTTSAPTSTTTTPAPGAPLCTKARHYFGAVPPKHARFVAFPGDYSTLEVCQACQGADEIPLYPFGSDDYQTAAGVASHDSPCVKTPCGTIVAAPQLMADATLFDGNYAGKAVFTAFGYGLVTELWSHVPGVGADMLDPEDPNWFRPKWIQCQSCPPGFALATPDLLPATLPISEASDYFATGVGGLRLGRTNDGAYVLVAPCERDFAFDCNDCPRGPDVGYRLEDRIAAAEEAAATPSTTTSTTTTTTTTTQAPCGCPRPGWCPAPFECAQLTCSVGGEIRGGVAPTSTTARPYPLLPCFPDSTTTSGPTTIPPGGCVGDFGTICTCGTSTTTSTTSTTGAPCDNDALPYGVCCPGFVWVFSGSGPFTVGCDQNGSCQPRASVTTTSAPTTPCPPCAGGCMWIAKRRWLTNDETGYIDEWEWNAGGTTTNPNGTAGYVPARCAPSPFFSNTIGNGSSVPGVGVSPFCLSNPFPCVCPPPSESAQGRCGDIVWTSCQSQNNPCACCSTTNNPCNKVCRYGQINGRWNLVSNPCPTTGCACPPASSIGITPETPCQQLTIGCGSTFPPTTGTPTTQAPTTQPVCPPCSSYTAPSSGNCLYAITAPFADWTLCSCNCLSGFVQPPAPPRNETGVCQGMQVACVPTTATPTTSTSTTPAPTGRCCYGSGGVLTNCSITSQAICDYMGDQPGYDSAWTAGTFSCIPNSCLPTTTTTAAPTGACCLPDTSCVILSAAACSSAGGTYNGDGSTCIVVTCTA